MLFGCVDSGRLILTNSPSHMLPYIDCGVGITASGGTIAEAGGRVEVWTPGRTRLLCCTGDVILAVAAAELESLRSGSSGVRAATSPEPACRSPP